MESLQEGFGSSVLTGAFISSSKKIVEKSANGPARRFVQNGILSLPAEEAEAQETPGRRRRKALRYFLALGCCSGRPWDDSGCRGEERDQGLCEGSSEGRGETREEGVSASGVAGAARHRRPGVCVAGFAGPLVHAGSELLVSSELAYFWFVAKRCVLHMC